jgi:flavin-dependent dehydrogenase
MTILHFDVCVLGNQLGGLMAAALLAQKGFRVALLNHSANDHQKPLANILLPRSPSLLLRPMGPFEEIIERLELRTEIKNCF